MNNKFFLITIYLLSHLSIYAVDSYTMVEAYLNNNKLEFESEEDFKEAISVGFFKLKKPESVDLEAGRRFAKSFSQDKKYIDVGVLNIAEGLLTSKENQTVRFTLEKSNWAKYYSEEIQRMAHALNDIGIMVLGTCFDRIGIPQEDWDRASSGSINNNGSHFMLFNSYDPENAKEGVPGVVEHKDWSYVTVLDTFMPGLEAFIDGEFRPIRLEDGYLTINFGRPLELLTEDTKYPVKASLHRVVTQKKDKRTSSVLFVDPNLSGKVWKYSKKGGLHASQTTEEFFKKCSEEIYGEKQDEI